MEVVWCVILNMNEILLFCRFGNDMRFGENISTFFINFANGGRERRRTDIFVWIYNRNG